VSHQDEPIAHAANNGRSWRRSQVYDSAADFGRIAIRHGHLPLAKRAGRKYAVAKVGFRDRTKSHDSSAPSHSFRLIVCHVGGAHDAPAFVELDIVEEPLHGPRPQRVATHIYFARRFGSVQVHRTVPG
jgi:hypothetical protein